MTIRSIEVGAGSDARRLVDETFAGAGYPLVVRVTNHMPRDVVFPEVQGLHLRHCAAAEGCEQVVSIPSEALFKRVASSIEQVATLNRYLKAVTIADAEDLAVVEAPKAASKKAASSSASGAGE